MILGLPFPTYLGWFAGPILGAATLIFCIWEYKKYLDEEKQKDQK